MDGSQTIREHLKCATRATHNALDLLMGPMALGDGYAEFLSIQYRARVPIEAWLERSASEVTVPRQTPLIARDLAELGIDVPTDLDRFEPDDMREALGICWTLAGSSMGNRAILMQRRKRGLDQANRFLCDPAMPAAWSRLRPVLETPTDEATAHNALRGAMRTFDRFLGLARREEMQIAA